MNEAPANYTIVVPRTGAKRKDGRAHYLVVVTGPEKGRRIVLEESVVRIGRVAPCEFLLSGPGISRTHCQVENRFGEIVITDLGSTNGTFIDGREIAGKSILPIGGMLQVGENVLHHEFRERKEVQESQELDRDLKEAEQYVQSLLPAPWKTGPVITEWIVQPSATLGGDALGYHSLDNQKYALYLVDVSGHGSGPAMHTVSIMNVLRYRALPLVDFTQPAQVLMGLNSMFKMEQHGDMYFTIWYGVYDAAERSLQYASGGHHPAFLVPPDRSATIPLYTRNVAVGAVPDYEFKSGTADIAPGSSFYLFSDGVFEIKTKEGSQWELANFMPLILQAPVAGTDEPTRLCEAVKRLTEREDFDDDFSVLFAQFP